MYKYLPIVVTILILANITVTVAMWGEWSYWSLQNYRSSVRAIDLPSPGPTPPQTNKVVLVIISGLGNDMTFDDEFKLPVFNQLRQAGASIVIHSNFPTYAETAWATLVTGASPELNDAPPLDKRMDSLNTLEVPTLFTEAKANGLQTALFGSLPWQALIPSDEADYTLFVNESDPGGDEALVEAALPAIEDPDYQFIVIQLSGLKLAAEMQGGPTGKAYQEAGPEIDAMLGQINLALNLSHSILVVTSDHGYLADGGFGGDEEEIRQLPFVLMGQNIVPGQYSQAEQVDIAPTLAVLLGLAPPAATQGRILFELIRLDDHDRAQAQLHLAQQRAALAQAYSSLLAGQYLNLPADTQQDLTRAQTFFKNQNINGTFELATLIQTHSNTLMASARHDFISSQQRFRLFIVTVIIGLWLYLMWRGRGPYTPIIVIAALITLAIYHGLYQLQGYSYSLSSFPDLTSLPLNIARRTAVSMLLGSSFILLMLLFSNERDWVVFLRVSYNFSLLVTFLFVLPLFWVFWQVGLASVWYLPDPTAAFWLITGLFEAGVAAALGLILPWPIMTLSGFVGLFRHRLSEAEPPNKTSSMSGLRY